jgi:hypothetical protein
VLHTAKPSRHTSVGKEYLPCVVSRAHGKNLPCVVLAHGKGNMKTTTKTFEKFAKSGK